MSDEFVEIEDKMRAAGYLIENGLICKRLPDGSVVPDWGASIEIQVEWFGIVKDK